MHDDDTWNWKEKEDEFSKVWISTFVTGVYQEAEFAKKTFPYVHADSRRCGFALWSDSMRVYIGGWIFLQKALLRDWIQYITVWYSTDARVSWFHALTQYRKMILGDVAFSSIIGLLALMMGIFYSFSTVWGQFPHFPWACFNFRKNLGGCFMVSRSHVGPI